MTPFILASKSQIRAAVLTNAGLQVRTAPADIDERAAEAPALERGAAPEEVALILARAKALHVSHQYPDMLVLGCDQTLSLDGRRFSKPRDRISARGQLCDLRGRTHMLSSGAALVRDGTVLWTGVSSAHLTMRAFTDAFLESYLDRAGDAVLSSVGGYQLEGVGIQLFERLEGDYFTILGLPLLPILRALRETGALES